jgi:DNA-binding MarR family transcriptional regulator
MSKITLELTDNATGGASAAVRLLLLESLREAGPHGVSEVALRAQLDLHGYSLTLSQLRSELRQLADKSYIGNLSHPLDDSLVHWTLTEQGRLILVEIQAMKQGQAPKGGALLRTPATPPAGAKEGA